MVSTRCERNSAASSWPASGVVKSTGQNVTLRPGLGGSRTSMARIFRQPGSDSSRPIRPEPKNSEVPVMATTCAELPESAGFLAT